jgi:O-antigen/teichoic acid export membrane protein
MHSRAAVAANFASFVVLGISGVATNIVLSRAYGADVLGAFNQLLSIYVVGSQLASGGSHLAAIRLIPLHAGDDRRERAIVIAALAMALGLSCVVGLAMVSGRSSLEAMFDSRLVGSGLNALTVALVMSGANKVFLGALNASERHNAFALVQSLRPLLVLIGCVLCWRRGLSEESVFLTIPLAEASVLAVAGSLVLSRMRWGREILLAWRGEFAEVRRFAIRVLPGGLITEANSRIDVLVLGVLASDRVVGLYSFASMYAEGLAQLPSVIRNAINARMARLSGDPRSLWSALPGIVRFAYLFLVPMFVLAAGVYYLIVWWTLPAADHFGALAVFAIILSCLIAAAGALPLDFTLSQMGFPGRLSALRGISFAFNLVGCVALYYVLGIYGVALSVGLTYVIFAAGTIWVVRDLVRSKSVG